MTDTSLVLQAAMLNDVNRLSVISQNLANGTTAGYKKQIPVNRAFAEYLEYENTDQMDKTNQNLVRFGAPYLDTVNDPSMGTVKYTGNALDLVADGNTYFTVLSPYGVTYTKQGSFHVDDTGVIVNPLGYPLLSENGEIMVNDKQPVIDREGNVLVDGNMMTRLKTVTFKPGTPLNSIGYGMYKNDSENVEPIDVTVNIKQGYLEMSNVSVMEEMVVLIAIMRHFEITQKFMLGYDDMLDAAINTVGEV